jgi:hypothetical protein
VSELSRTAILGTGQAPGRPKSETDADGLIDALDLSSDEERDTARERELLLRAGAAAVLQRAGTLALLWSAPIPTAGEETEQRASASLGGMLAGLLGGDFRELLAETFEKMAAARLRLPEELLPAALAEEDPALREQLRPLLGARGRWLADQGTEEAWSWARSTSAPDAVNALPPDADTRWGEGTAAEREVLLGRARRVQPERARAWVESSFRADKPEQRRRWIELLEIGLSPADIPFLESALGDRSTIVRIRAARALWRLPESGVAKAVRVRVEALIRPGLEVVLPEEPYDPALEKLGIVEHPPPGAGKRQWWLAQLLSATPPERSLARLGGTPAELVARAAQHDLAEALLDGWTSAVLRFGSGDFYLPLWDAWSQQEDAKSWTTALPLAELTERLVCSPARPELEARLLAQVRAGRHLELLRFFPRPWPAAIALECLGKLRAREPSIAWVLPTLATRCPLELIPEDFEFPTPLEQRNYFDDAVHKLVYTLDQRRRLDREIQAHSASEVLP